MAYLESHPPGRALDLGCGTGTNVITIAQHGWDVRGIDFVPQAIRTARCKTRRAGIQADLRTGDVTHLVNVNGPFNLILDIGCFHTLTPQGRQACFDQVTRLLDRQGTYLLYTFIQATPSSSLSGVSEAEIQEMASRLQLVQRQDGSERGQRPSSWLTFRPKGEQ